MNLPSLWSWYICTAALLSEKISTCILLFWWVPCCGNVFLSASREIRTPNMPWSSGRYYDVMGYPSTIKYVFEQILRWFFVSNRSTHYHVSSQCFKGD
jgi:hypothetical protein